METSTSPVKRRAALAPLNANVMPNMSSPAGKPGLMLAGSNSSPLKEGRKRAVEDEMDGNPAFKKTCVLDEDAISRSQSPDTSSMFDLSGDMSWATSISTEPETNTIPIAPITRPRSLTREQAREKAEILRLRLGLASYKLRTGQTSLPLSQLLPKPLPRRSNAHIRSQSLNSIPQLSITSSSAASSSQPLLPPPQPQRQRQRQQRQRQQELEEEHADIPTGDTTEEAESSSQGGPTSPVTGESEGAAVREAVAVITGLQPSLLPDNRIATAGDAAAVAALSLSLSQ